MTDPPFEATMVRPGRNTAFSVIGEETMIEGDETLPVYDPLPLPTHPPSPQPALLVSLKVITLEALYQPLEGETAPAEGAELSMTR